MKAKLKKTKDLAPTARVNYFPHEYKATLGEFTSGWKRDLREALLGLKALVPETAGATLDKRDAVR